MEISLFSVQLGNIWWDEKKYIPLTLVIRVKKLPNEIRNVGRRKMRMLNNSQDIADLRIPPSNRLEKLTGNLKEFYSIRINKQWRIIFIWNNGNASEVKIVDYH
jgi:proteic killer suppression protein